jgi:hypothetical protein
VGLNTFQLFESQAAAMKMQEDNLQAPEAAAKKPWAAG